MNIILLVIDTLRYDYVAAHGKNDRIQTPNLDRLAGSSWRFDQAYSSSYPTIPYRTDAITGRYGNPFNPWSPLRFDVMTRSGEHGESLPPAERYAPVYRNMLRAIRGEDFGPKASEYAVDVAIAQAAYASSRDGQAIDLTSPAWTAEHEQWESKNE